MTLALRVIARLRGLALSGRGPSGPVASAAPDAPDGFQLLLGADGQQLAGADGAPLYGIDLSPPAAPTGGFFATQFLPGLF